jgi:proteasome lid subunit RPN8/RPN11
MLILPQTLAEQLRRWAVAGYPEEVCGLLIGRHEAGRVRVERVQQARNLNRERARDRYELDPQDYLAADRQAREEGLDVVGIWHSHPDHPARPSETDLAAAWDSFSYVILSTGREAVSDVRSFRLQAGAFVEESIQEAAR